MRKNLWKWYELAEKFSLNFKISPWNLLEFGARFMAGTLTKMMMMMKHIFQQKKKECINHEIFLCSGRLVVKDNCIHYSQSLHEIWKLFVRTFLLLQKESVNLKHFHKQTSDIILYYLNLSMMISFNLIKTKCYFPFKNWYKMYYCPCQTTLHHPHVGFAPSPMSTLNHPLSTLPQMTCCARIDFI